jgi:hypothetical protein
MAIVRGEAVEWWTPTGNPVNVFFLFPLAALHTVFGPSFIVLRSVALASGVLALVANYWLCRRVFDLRTATVSTLLLALLPINIAYSRFAWDASQSLLATVLVLYLPLWHYRRTESAGPPPVAGMLAFAAAILVHPTNLFAAPLLVMPIVAARRTRAWETMRTADVDARPWKLAVLAGAGIVAAYAAWLALSRAALEARGPGEMLAFLEHYLKLFSGATVYEYVSGEAEAGGRLSWIGLTVRLCTIGFGAALVFGAWGMLRRLVDAPNSLDACVGVGWAIMLGGFFVVAGPNAIAPQWERYGICLVAPGALVLARGWGWWLEGESARGHVAAWILSAAAWIFPATFYLGYFDFIERTGGSAHVTFRTGPVEPKLAAFRYIAERRSPARRAQIVAGEWWNYWPLAYLAGGSEGIDVTAGQPWERQRAEPATRGVEETWYVEFADTAAERAVLRSFEQLGQKAERTVVNDYGGRPLLSIIGPIQQGTGNY